MNPHPDSHLLMGLCSYVIMFILSGVHYIMPKAKIMFKTIDTKYMYNILYNIAAENLLSISLSYFKAGKFDKVIRPDIHLNIYIESTIIDEQLIYSHMIEIQKKCTRSIIRQTTYTE